MIDNNGRKTRGFKGFVGILLMNRLRDMNSKHEELKALVVSWFNRKKSYLWLTEAFSCTLKESKKWMPECFAGSALFPPQPPSQSKVSFEI